MIGTIIQARTGSTRFPRKIYQDINGKYTLQRVLEGVKKSIVPHKIILAMPEYDKQEFEERFARGDFKDFTDERFGTYFGSPDNLVDRYLGAARAHGIDLIVRVTADCPLIQGELISEMLLEYLKNGYNGYMGCNEIVAHSFYPDGVDCEIFPYWMLAEASILTKNPVHLEHCCPYFYRRGTQYNLYSFENRRPHAVMSCKFPNFSFDTKEDLWLIEEIAKHYDVCGDLNAAIKNTNVTKLFSPDKCEGDKK